jgi:hypothetical protein
MVLAKPFAIRLTDVKRNKYINNMHDYLEISNYEDREEFCGLAAIQQNLNWALSLPGDEDFKELCTFVKNTQSCEGIIEQIRKGYKDPDSLAKIKSAIECMMKETS